MMLMGKLDGSILFYSINMPPALLDKEGQEETTVENKKAWFTFLFPVIPVRFMDYGYSLLAYSDHSSIPVD